VSAWIWRKHQYRLSKFPWSLVSLVDPRVDEGCKRSIAERWDNARACCLRKGTADRLKDLGVSSQRLQSDTATFLWFFAESVKLTVADVEVLDSFPHCRMAPHLLQEWCSIIKWYACPFVVVPLSPYLSLIGGVCIASERGCTRVSVPMPEPYSLAFQSPPLGRGGGWPKDRPLRGTSIPLAGKPL
jgi:hypothetical protein